MTLTRPAIALDTERWKVARARAYKLRTTSHAVRSAFWLAAPTDSGAAENVSGAGEKERDRRINVVVGVAT